MINSDEIEVCQVHHELADAVKSKAVVKFAAVEVPAKFNRLECNTDLNQPPSNWLTTSDESCGLHQALYHSSGFASFQMAHMFPDCVGEVDVVTDAESIKRLLKLPYTTKGAVSMLVHKVGNTLLMDEFDIQKYLLRKTDCNWAWLRNFILKQLLTYGDKDHNFSIKDKSREAIQSKNLLSKFLYYSLNASSLASPVQQTQDLRPPLPISEPVLPEPKIDENMPDSKSSHVYNRNVVWTFEDIRMLIGTDMPIFGGPNRPCISLRLRDMAKPINVLTGIDYWLDNLMCNVPEVVMCYHLDGIVQKYEIIKTEDLPYLENSQFSPQVVRNVAQNILAFLKANATKSGHTYWLFKGRNDDVVKLYDLTTLCNSQTDATNEECDEDDSRQESPFTVPVAMLLYTVARNMKHTASRITSKTAGTIRALLDNCIKLLPKEKYPQIVTSSHYILSDLHIPAGIDPKSPNFDADFEQDSDTQSLYDDEVFLGDSDDDFNYNDPSEKEEEDDVYENVAVQSICDTLKEFHSAQGGKRAATTNPMPLVAGTEERCQIALEHISAGISCLQFFDSNEEKFVKESEARAKAEEKQRILQEEQNPTMAKSFKPIPLPYESLSECQAKDKGQKNIVAQEGQTPQLSVGRKEPDVLKGKKSKKQGKKREQVDFQTPMEPSNTPVPQQQKQVAINFNSKQFGSWNVHLKLLMMEKACLTFATQAEYNYVLQKYGCCLRDIYMSCRCQHVVVKYMATMISQKSCLLGRAGDCFFQMAKNWHSIDLYVKEFFVEPNALEQVIIDQLENDLDGADLSELIAPAKNIEHVMVSSCKCYETALSLANKCVVDEDNTAELLRRLGNVRNELGLKYMYWAQEELARGINTNRSEEYNNCDDRDRHTDSIDKGVKEENTSILMQLTMKSYDSLTCGIAAFTMVQDKANLAFLYCNMGRFMRFRAHLQIEDKNCDFLHCQKKFYREAFLNYENAREVLGTRKKNAELWDLVNWELSTATFTLAKIMQDNTIADDKNASRVEKEVLDLLQKSLTLCDVDHPGTRLVLYSYRSASIQKRIASFHYSQMRRNGGSDMGSMPKTTLQLCKYHYEKASIAFESLKEPSDGLITQLERISLQEFLTDRSSYNSHKIRNMQGALDLCLATKNILDCALNNYSECDDDTVPLTNMQEDFYGHILLFESRLQNALKLLIKLMLNSKDPKKLTELYKGMYKETLSTSATVVNGQLNLKCLLDQTRKIRNLIFRLDEIWWPHFNRSAKPPSITSKNQTKILDCTTPPNVPFATQ